MRGIEEQNTWGGDGLVDTNGLAVELIRARMLLREMMRDGRDVREQNLFEYLQLWVKYHQELLEELEGWYDS